MAHTFDPSTQDIEADLCEFQATQGYIVKTCLKKI